MKMNARSYNSLEFNVRCFMESYINILLNQRDVDFFTCDLETARNTFNYWISQTKIMRKLAPCS